MAEVVYNRTAGSTGSDVAALIAEGTLVELLAVAQDAWAHLLTTTTFRDLVQAVLDANASRPVGDLLAEADVTPESVVAFARPWLLRAADDGVLEELIRERLAAFYATYE